MGHQGEFPTRPLGTVLNVGSAPGVTAFPAGITTGSTWDTALMYARGNALGII
jgi:beta-glucosidase-like glycosyl hydrolase